jgi:hypothetical protein
MNPKIQPWIRRLAPFALVLEGGPSDGDGNL